MLWYIYHQKDQMFHYYQPFHYYRMILKILMNLDYPVYHLHQMNQMNHWIH